MRDAAAATARSASGPAASASKARTFSAQPNGDSQVGHELCMRVRSLFGVPSALPMPARTNVTTRIHTATALAPRAVGMSCAATSPTPRKTMPTSAHEAPTSADPTTAALFVTNAAATRAPRAMFAPAPWSTVASSGIRRPAGVAERSSRRPSSSSPRVCRTARKELMSAASSSSHGRSRNTTICDSPAPEGRPRKSRMTGFAITVASSATRSCSPPYDVTTPAKPDAASAAVPPIQRMSCTASRRRRWRHRSRTMLIARCDRRRGCHSAAGTAPRARGARSAGPPHRARRDETEMPRPRRSGE